MYRVLLMVTRNPTWLYWSKGGSSNAIWVFFIQVLLFLELRHKFEDLSNYHRSCFAHSRNSRKGNIMFSCAKCWCWCFTNKNLKCLKLTCRLVAVETARQNLHFFSSRKIFLHISNADSSSSRFEGKANQFWKTLSLIE